MRPSGNDYCELFIQQPLPDLTLSSKRSNDPRYSHAALHVYGGNARAVYMNPLRNLFWPELGNR